MRIYFPIEVKNRELVARVYLAVKISLKGASVVIGNTTALLRRQNIMQKGIYVFKSIQPHQFEVIKNFKKKNFKIVSFDEEGLMFFTAENYVRRFVDKNLDLVDIFFSWGQREKEALISKFKKYENIIKIVGNPRLDILKHPLSKIFKNDVSDLKKKHGEFILLTTKFARNNPIRRGWRTFYIGQKSVGYITSPHNREYAILSQYHEKKNLKAFLKFIKNFSKQFPDKKLIVRMHPAEDHTIWFKNLSHLKNIVLSYDNISTNAYILASKFVIQSNCTTSIEAFLLNKLSINYLPYQNIKVEYQGPKLVSENIFSENDLINFVKNNKNFERKKLSDDEKTNLKKLANNINTDDCIDRMFDEFKKIHNFENEIDRNSNILNFYFIKLQNIIRNIYYSLKKRNKFEKGSAKLQKQKIPSLTFDEILKLKNEICNQMGIDSFKIDLIEKYPDFFEFKINNSKIKND